MLQFQWIFTQQSDTDFPPTFLFYFLFPKSFELGNMSACHFALQLFEETIFYFVFSQCVDVHFVEN